jgi:serine/threonine protein kinase
MLNQGDQVGPYIVRRYLGSSGIGAGYEVEHGAMGTTHWLNVLPLSSPRVAVELSDQFGFVHPNVLTTLALLQAGGSMALLTDMFAGRPLGDIMAEHDMSIGQRLDIFREILLGVGAAHASGILHLDLRPSYVLIGGPIEAPIVKVAFFRIARLLKEIDEGGAVSTNRFAAPEVMMPGIELGASADVFALAAIGYEMLSGRPAFSGNTPAAVRAKTMGKFEPLSSLVPEVPGAVSDAIGQGLLPRPYDRHASIEEFGIALFGPNFHITHGERREVQDGTARPASSRPTPIELSRAAAPPEPQTEEEREAAMIPRAVLFGGLGATLAFLVLIVSIAGLGAMSVGSALDQAGALAGPTTKASLEVSGLVDDVIALGGDGARLLPLQRAFNNASNQKKIPTGYRLYQELNVQLESAVAKGRDPEAARRIQYELDVAGNQFEAYVGAVQAWNEATSSFVGGAAVRLGIAAEPGPELVDMLEGAS